MDPGPNQSVSQEVRTVDIYGNVTERDVYDFNQSSPARIYTYNYHNESQYLSRHIYNRVLSAWVQPQGGSLTVLFSQQLDTVFDGSALPAETPPSSQARGGQSP